MYEFIETFSGRFFYFDDPDPELILQEDIAHALGNLCRFGGHCSRFYSVAEHSMLVCSLLERSFSSPVYVDLWLAGLLHDATEAYIVDVPNPVKALLPAYVPLEKNVGLAIEARFGLSGGALTDPRIKRADRDALMTEAICLLPSMGKLWESNGTGVAHNFNFWSPTEAEFEFSYKLTSLLDKQESVNGMVSFDEEG